MNSEAAAQGRATKRRKSDYTEEVVVVVGQEAKRITAHKNILCSSSAFFKAACTGEWKEAENKIVKLPEATENTFLTYINWLYMAILDLYSEDRSLGRLGNSPEYADQSTPRVVSLMSSYILGDFLGDTRLCNALMDEMVRVGTKSKGVANVWLITRYWPKLPATSGMRRFLVDLEACYGDPDELELYPSDFILVVAQAYMKQRTKSLNERKPEKRDSCYYHNHRDADKCASS